MQDRIVQELALLRKRYPGLEYCEEGRWVKVPSYPMPEGWGRPTTDVAFQIPSGFPGTPPYGIFVPAGIKFNSETPAHYTEPASNQPPFGGTWGVFSWAHIEGEWRATADPVTGSNLSNWVSGFADRFAEGK